MRRTNNARRGLGIRGQLMFFLCFICLFLLVLFWILSTQLLEPLYTRHIERQLTTQAENVVSQLDNALAEGTTLSSWSFGRLYVNTGFFDKLAMDLYSKGALSSFCVDISDSTLRQIYKIENQSYCNLHETYLSDASSNEVVNTAIAMRKKCRTSPGGFKQTLAPPVRLGPASGGPHHSRRQLHRAGDHQSGACGRGQQRAENPAAAGGGPDLCLCHVGGVAVQ